MYIFVFRIPVRLSNPGWLRMSHITDVRPRTVAGSVPESAAMRRLRWRSSVDAVSRCSGTSFASRWDMIFIQRKSRTAPGLRGSQALCCSRLGFQGHPFIILMWRIPLKKPSQPFKNIHNFLAVKNVHVACRPPSGKRLACY